MQTLLSDIELDIQELKCLVQAISGDANPALKTVAKRHIRQMEERLEALAARLDALPASDASVASAEPTASPAETDVSVESSPVVAHPDEVLSAVVQPKPAVVSSQVSSPILAERIKPSGKLRRAISLNDSFRFTRELFDGDAARMNETVQRIGEAASLDEALDIFHSVAHPDEENAAATDFMELLKKYFS